MMKKHPEKGIDRKELNMFDYFKEKSDARKINDFYNMFVEIYSEHLEELNTQIIENMPENKRSKLTHTVAILMMLSNKVAIFKEELDKVDKTIEKIMEGFGCDPDTLKAFIEKNKREKQ